ncbi:heterokaryon incompatibility protein-domain-containing protein [Pisolithus marmoratus]|nr:heterokaryon incompatibility protein-domain-containing protein [Pisolithus marmoratus]
MRLIDVVTMLNLETSFDEEKNVPRTTKVLKEFFGPDLAEKEYAILSHCWGVEKEGEQEVLFEDMKQLLTVSDEERKEIRGRTGYMKIVDTCRRARKDGLEWVWVDTCCINKESSSELSEAINSMYKWYANAELCYAYLHDTLRDSWIKGIKSMATPKWFSRGWTLQELIAPKVVHFLDRKWERIGDKAGLAWTLSRITPIPEKVLKEGLQKALSSVNDYDRPSVAQIFSWAAHRTTTREEDRAYSLLGLLGVHMPMLYGEGKNAFRRLQLEIIRTSNDQSIFAWGHQREFGWSSSILADDPSCFEDCGGVAALRPESFTARLREMGMPDEKLAGKSTQKRIRTFTVTNDGIQIWLPTATFGSYAQVTLACYRKSDPDYPLITLITIHLVFPGSTFYRVFGLRKYPGKMEFEQHLLPYKEAEYPSTFTFELHDQTLSHDGFVVNRVFPDRVVTDGSVTLSSNEDVAAIDYVREKDDTSFLVVLSYCGGRHSVSAVLNFAHNMAHLRSRAFERLCNSNHELTHAKHLMQHIHFRRSIEGVRVVHGAPCDSSVRCTVKIDIVKCFGCCAHKERLALSENYPAIPFSLIESELRPGDYGRVPQGRHNFEPEGNIIEFATCLGLGPFEDDRGIRLPELESVQPWRSLLLSVPGHGNSHHLDMYDGTGWTLQANQQVVLLLKALSSHLAGRLLVTTVIRYSDPLDLRPRLYSTFAPRNRLDLDAWEPLLRFPPLCLVAMPLTWHHIDIDWEFMTMLLKII